MLRWYQRLTVKFGAFALVAVLLLGGAVWNQYVQARQRLAASSAAEARLMAETLAAAIRTFVLELPEGGAAIDRLEEQLNPPGSLVAIRVIHSDVINVQYQSEPKELPEDDRQYAALVDGKTREYETADAFVHVAPILTVEGCGQCHQRPDGSGLPVEPGTVIGLVEGSFNKAPMEERLAALTIDSLKSAGLMLFLLLVLFGLITWKVLIPLERLSEVADRVLGGDLACRADTGLSNEIGMLAESFNTMTEGSQRFISRLRQWGEDMTDEVRLHTLKIRRLLEHHKAIIDSVQRIVLTVDRDLAVTQINAEWDIQAARYGIGLEGMEMIGTPLCSLIPAGHCRGFETTCREILDRPPSEERSLHRQEETVDLPGGRRVFSLTVSPLVEGGGVTGLVLVVTDITERKKTEELLRVERNKLNAMMDGMGDPVMIVEPDLTVSYMNRIMLNTFNGDDRFGERCYAVIAGGTGRCPGCRAGTTDQRTTVEIEGEDGRFYLATHSPVTNAEGGRSVIGVYKDITFRKEMEERLRAESITDPLTGLFNKRHFAELIATETARSSRYGSPLSLIFADIDKFKSYNDTFGHVEGDDCLSTLGKIIRETIREDVDFGFRYGGEEFTILLPNTGSQEAAMAANRIREQFAAHTFKPCLQGECQEVTKTISMGVAAYRPKEPVETFIDRADDAMYRAKRAGADRVLTAEGD